MSELNGITKINGNSLTLLQGNTPKISGGLLIVSRGERAISYCKAIERIESRRTGIIEIVEPGNRSARVIDRPRITEIPSNDLPFPQQDASITVRCTLREFLITSFFLNLQESL